MKSTLSVIVAALFAAASFNVAAQAKDPTTKDGGAVKDKSGTSVGRKDVKDKPKNTAEMPKVEKREKKEKPAKTEVKTKSGGAVTTKDGKDVKSTK